MFHMVVLRYNYKFIQLLKTYKCKGSYMNAVNNQIEGFKNDILLLAQLLNHSNKNEIDQYKST